MSTESTDTASADDSPPRFVIQHHRTRDGEHWDLMLEEGSTLLTWQLRDHPESVDRAPIPARRIGEHRKAYLTYEGPVSRGRGTVQIFDRGTYRLLERGEGRLRLELHGDRLGGVFDLRQTPGQRARWTLSRAGPDKS